MKINQLKSRLIKVGVISAAGVLVTVGVFFLMMAYSGSLQSDMENTNLERDKYNAKFEEVFQRNQLTRKAYLFYNEYNNETEEYCSIIGIKEDCVRDKLLRRDVLKSVLTDISDELMLQNLTFSPDAFVVRGGVFRKNYATLVSSKVTLEFSTISDIVAFQALQRLEQKVPGSIEIISFEITKSREYTPQDLMDLSEGTVPGIVQVKIVFNWLGIKEFEQSQEVTK